MRFNDFSIRAKLLVNALTTLVLLVSFLLLSIYSLRMSAHHAYVQERISTVTSAMLSLSQFMWNINYDFREDAEKESELNTHLVNLQEASQNLDGNMHDKELQAQIAQLNAGIDSLPNLVRSFLTANEVYFDGVAASMDLVNKLASELDSYDGVPVRAWSNFAEFSSQILRFYWDELENDAQFDSIVRLLQLFGQQMSNIEPTMPARVNTIIESCRVSYRHMVQYGKYRVMIFQRFKRVAGELDRVEDTGFALTRASQDRLLYTYFGILALITVVLLAFARLMTTSIAMPIKAVSEVLDRFRNGDIRRRGAIDSLTTRKDEVGQMVRNLKNLGNTLNEVVGEVRATGLTLIEANSQLMESSKSISTMASRQAANAEEMSSTMEEMTASMQHTSDNAKHSEMIYRKSMSSLETLREVTQQSTEVVANIGGKIGVMNGIAQQTNILALNAAVEAARAGDHGRGFAVVASEVRKLAEQSTKAADEVIGLVDNAVKFSAKASSEFTALLPELQETQRLTLEVSAASDQQRQGADQINTSSQHLSELAQSNAASSEELAASAESLMATANKLLELLNYYKTN